MQCKRGIFYQYLFCLDLRKFRLRQVDALAQLAECLHELAELLLGLVSEHADLLAAQREPRARVGAQSAHLLAELCRALTGIALRSLRAAVRLQLVGRQIERLLRNGLLRRFFSARFGCGGCLLLLSGVMIVLSEVLLHWLKKRGTKRFAEL